MRLLRTLFGPSGADSTERLFDVYAAEVRLCEEIIRGLERDKANLYRESLYWRDKFMTLMGVGDMSYPAMGMDKPAPEKEDEQEPTHVSLIGLRARHELEAKQRAREMEREKKA